MKPAIVNSVVKHKSWKPIYNRMFSTSTQEIRVEVSKHGLPAPPTDYADLALYRILLDV